MTFVSKRGTKKPPYGGCTSRLGGSISWACDMLFHEPPIYYFVDTRYTISPTSEILYNNIRYVLYYLTFNILPDTKLLLYTPIPATPKTFLSTFLRSYLRSYFPISTKSFVFRISYLTTFYYLCGQMIHIRCLSVRMK